MPDLGVQVRLERGVPVVTAPACVDITTADMLRVALLRTAAHGYATVVVDMTRTQVCDSLGLSVLTRAHKRAIGEGGELRLATASPGVLRVLSVTRLDCHLPVFATVDNAVAKLPAAAIQPLPSGLMPPVRGRHHRTPTCAGPHRRRSSPGT